MNATTVDGASIKDGGAFYPRTTEQTLAGFQGTQSAERGVTLRDYIALEVLKKMIEVGSSSGRAVDTSYNVADEMIKRRKIFP